MCMRATHFTRSLLYIMFTYTDTPTSLAQTPHYFMFANTRSVAIFAFISLTVVFAYASTLTLFATCLLAFMFTNTRSPALYAKIGHFFMRTEAFPVTVWTSTLSLVMNTFVSFSFSLIKASASIT